MANPVARHRHLVFARRWLREEGEGMNRIAMTALAAAACLLAATAGAGSPPMSSTGWEFAKWGMTPAQLRAASHGAVPKSNAGYDAMAGKYSMGKFKFDVVLDYSPRAGDPGNYDPRNLIFNAALLNLDASSGSCTDLTAYLETAYGKPDRTFSAGPAGYLWTNKKIGDVQYSTWDGNKTCSVMYMPFGGHDK
jgi:hypothetical protein